MMRRLLIALLVVAALATGAAAQQSNVTNAVVIAALQAMGLFGDGYANGQVPVWSTSAAQYQPGTAVISLNPIFTGQMTGPTNNTCVAPTYSATGQTGTGMSISTTPSILLGVSGTCRVTITAASMASTLPIAIGVSPADIGSILRVPNNETIIFARNGVNNANIGMVYLDASNTWQYANAGNAAVFGGNFSLAANRTLGLTATGLGTTTVSALSLINTTAATGAATVQASPTFNLQGTAWDTAASQTLNWGFKVLPATAATPTSTLQFLHSLNGAAATVPLTVSNSGNLSIPGAIQAPNGSVDSLGVAVTNRLGFFFKGGFEAPFNGLINGVNDDGSLGIQFNIGTAAPTVTSCGTGTITDAGGVAGAARNQGGMVTATGATVCTIDFALPDWSFVPSCSITLHNATVAFPPYISAKSVGAMTISGLTAGDVFTYVCIGRV